MDPTTKLGNTQYLEEASDTAGKDFEPLDDEEQSNIYEPSSDEGSSNALEQSDNGNSSDDEELSDYPSGEEWVIGPDDNRDVFLVSMEEETTSEVGTNTSENHSDVSKGTPWDQIMAVLKSESHLEWARKLDPHLCYDRDGKNSCAKYATSSCREAKCNVCVDLEFAKDDAERVSRRVPSIIHTYMSRLQESSGLCQKCEALFEGIRSYLTTPTPGSQFALNWEDLVRQPVELYQTHRGTVGVVALGMGLEFFTQASCAPPLDVFRQIIPTPAKPTPEYCVAFVQNHLNNCDEQHKEFCMPSSSRSLPKRVLDLWDHLGNPATEVVKLLEVQGNISADYVALSHCWGPPGSVFKTTKETLDEHMLGIKLKDLSPTFQNAITITLKLGIRYIWIDSLCIIQNDKPDWEIESSKMADIYSNCTLAVAATGSDSSEGGCLFDRWTQERGLKTLKGPMALKISGREGEIEVYVQPRSHYSHIFPYSDPGDGPQSALLRRAWAFQERILAPRIIHFHHEELVWECRSVAACECGALNPSPQKEKGHRWALKRTFNEITDNISHFETSPLDFWMETIAYFSRMLITNETDRLPALAGIAGRLSTSFQDGYLAGLWRSELPKLLCWKRRPGSVAGKLRYLRTARDPNIPSWSWASLKPDEAGTSQPIYFETGLVVDKGLKILDASCGVSEANIFGNVSGGSIRIRGAVFAAKIAHFHSSGNLHWHEIASRCCGKVKKLGTLILDISCEQKIIPTFEDISCLILGTQVGTGVALVTRNVRGDQFERVGLFVLEKMNLGIEAKYMTLTLI